MNNPEKLSKLQGKFAQAEQLYKRSLAIWEHELSLYVFVKIGLYELIMR